MLSLGLAVIFGLLNIINFTHGAQYMMGAFVAYLSLTHLGLAYWWALLLAPIAVGLFGILLERTMLHRLYKLDHLYGLLLTFGLALIVEGFFRNQYGSSGLPYSIPAELRGGYNLGFMFLPTYRAWVVVASVIVCFGTWFVIERTKLGAYLRAATENPTLVQAFGVNVPRMVTLTYGFGVALAAFAGVMAAPIYQVSPLMGRTSSSSSSPSSSSGHGINPGRHRHRVRAGRHRGPHQGLLSRGVEHGDLRHHGDRADDQAGRPLRPRHLEERRWIAAPGSRSSPWSPCWWRPPTSSIPSSS